MVIGRGLKGKERQADMDNDDIYEAYKRLAAEILATAVRDYRTLYRRLLDNINNNSAEWGRQMTLSSLRKAEEDFASDYYTILLKGIGSDIPGEQIPAFIRKQEDERYAKLKLQKTAGTDRRAG